MSVTISQPAGATSGAVASNALDALRSKGPPAAQPQYNQARRPNPDGPIAPEAAMPSINPGLKSLASFELLQREAKLFSYSTMVPPAYRAFNPESKKKDAPMVANPNGLSNCVIALHMAKTLNADPLMIMQNLHVIEGRPNWSAPFVIGSINSSGNFKSKLRFHFVDKGTKNFTCVEKGWEDGRPYTRNLTVSARDFECYAWALDEDGDKVKGQTITMQMAMEEGWYIRAGSKWQGAMAEQMAQYRAATFFCRLHCPEILMGFGTEDEAYDTIEAEPNSYQETNQLASNVIEGEATLSDDSSRLEIEGEVLSIAHDQTPKVDINLDKPEPETVLSPQAEALKKALHREPQQEQKPLTAAAEQQERVLRGEMPEGTPEMTAAKVAPVKEQPRTPAPPASTDGFGSLE